MILTHLLPQRFLATTLISARADLLLHLLIFLLKIINLLFQSRDLRIGPMVLEILEDLVHVESIVYVNLWKLH